MAHTSSKSAALATLVALVCALVTDAGAVQHKKVEHVVSNMGLERLRVDMDAGKQFPEKKVVVDGTLLPNDGTTANNQAVCGKDTSVFSSFKNVCKMTFTAAGGGSFVCSAWLLKPNKLGTAGHCVLDGDGWILSGFVTCGGVRKAITRASTPTTYYDRVFVNGGNGVHWSDGAVITVGSNFPATAEYKPYKYRIAQNCARGKSLTVTVAGYPAESGGRAGCHYNGIQQWKSKGPMGCTLYPGFDMYPTSFDSCGGGSGSRVVDAQNYAVGIFTAALTWNANGTCATNLVTRILDPNGKGKGVLMSSLL